MEIFQKKELNYLSKIPMTIKEIVGPPIKRCGACIINGIGDQCLLVQQKYSQKWGFPKGGLNPNESYFNCMKREVREETGVDLNKSRFKLCFNLKIGEYYLYVIQLLQKSRCFPFLRIGDKNEINHVCWINFEDLLNYDLNYVSKQLIQSEQFATLTYQLKNSVENIEINFRQLKIKTEETDSPTLSPVIKPLILSPFLKPLPSIINSSIKNEPLETSLINPI